MEQITNTNNGCIERQNAGGAMTSVQEFVGVSGLSTKARVELAIKQQPEFAILRAKLPSVGVERCRTGACKGMPQPQLIPEQTSIACRKTPNLPQ